METNRYRLIALIIIFTLSCEFVSWGGPSIKTFSEKVDKYPVSFTGSARVSTPYGTTNCVREGTAQFTATENSQCSLYVSFPMTHIDTQGKCVDSGDTQAWLLKGSFEKALQVCNPVSCNDHPDYYASGKVKFLPTGTEVTTVSCSLEKNSKLQVSIDLGELKPAK